METANRLLIVEDSRAMLCAVEAVLKDTLDYPVDCAASLAEAKVLLDRHPGTYLAAVLDLHLPDADNGEMVDLALARGIPVIVLTGDINEQLRSIISARPIVDYVVKQNVNSLRTVGQDIVRLVRNPAQKVLIVEGSESFRQHLQEILENQKLNVLVAANALEALELSGQHPDISLALIDLLPPDFKGIELTASLRARYPSTQMAVIGISASSDPFVAVRFIKAGGDDVLRKPYLTEELVSRVNARLDNLDNINTIMDQANRDYLTGLYNRRHLFNAGASLYENARREHIRLMVAILDIDHFKKINDTWGHEAGDTVLKVVAKELKTMLRKSDIVARIGGEEFCIVAVNAESPFDLMEKIRRRVEELQVDIGGGQTLSVTLSAGVSLDVSDSLEAMMRKADAALYAAKASGRNRTMLAGQATD